MKSVQILFFILSALLATFVFTVGIDLLGNPHEQFQLKGLGLMFASIFSFMGINKMFKSLLNWLFKPRFKKLSWE